MKRLIKLLMAVSPGALVSACGTDSSSGDGSSAGAGAATRGVTDAPIDNLVPGDINELSLLNVEPITTTNNYNPVNGLYLYEAAFLPAGDYTVAFTCNSNLEDLEADDDLKFFQTTEVTVLVTNTLFLNP